MYTLEGWSSTARNMEETLRAANNYASTLNVLKRFEEAKALLRKTMPVARRFSEKDIDSRSK